jgi:alpha-glucosidase
MRAERLLPVHIRTNQAVRLGDLPPGAWPCNTLGNHDTPRLWSRYGDGVHDAALARVHAALMLTLKGTPVLYNGEEIGMTNLELTSLSQIRDSAAVNHYRLLTDKLGKTPEQALKTVINTTRDRCRSPLQWNAEPNAGFSPPHVAPWLPVNPNYADGVNVVAQENDPASLLNFYRTLLRLRRTTPALSGGDYRALHTHSEQYFSFLRHDANSGQTCFVVLNFADHEQTIGFDLPGRQPHRLFSSHNNNDQALSLDSLTLAPFEILIIELG